MDVDIDVQPSFKAENYFPNWVKASILKDGVLSAHPCGVYPQSIAEDAFTKLSAIPYESAEELGYLKVDFLHLNVYSNFKNKAEIDDLLNKQPDWTLLQLPSTWPKLFQLAKHGEMLQSLKPKSVEDIADIMALIRPGKKGLLGLYKKERAAARQILYAKDDEGYSFKRSHAVAYALVVVLQLHLIEQGRL